MSTKIPKSKEALKRLAAKKSAAKKAARKRASERKKETKKRVAAKKAIEKREQRKRATKRKKETAKRVAARKKLNALKIPKISEKKISNKGTVEIDANEVEAAIEKCTEKFFGSEKKYLSHLLRMMLMSNTIPIDLLEYVPVQSPDVGKTCFDQLYDAAMEIAFPDYSPETIQRLLGPNADKSTSKTKIWRVVLPPKFKLAHVLIRADSYQEAFALACDYVCRVSVRVYGRIPADLTIRVMLMTEKAMRRRLDIRWANRSIKRRQLQLVGRIYTPKEVQGARLVALGHPEDPNFKVVRYIEKIELSKIAKAKNLSRVSSVESEVFYKNIDDTKQ